MISYAAALLVDRGIIGLDHDVNDYIGFTLRHPQHLSTVITLRMLLTHMSSINDAAEWYSRPLLCVRGDSALSNGDWLHTYLTESGQYYGGVDNINGSWFDKKPGHSYAYSNEGASLAALVAERMAQRAGLISSNETVSDLVRRFVFAPLGVAKHDAVSYFLRDLPSSPSELQHPTALYPGRPHLRALEEYFVYDYPEYPCGRWMASPRDQAALLISFINNGTSPGLPPLLNASTVEEMRRPQPTVRGADPQVKEGQGLIWYYREQAGRRLLGHNGCDYGTSTDMFFNPDTGAGFLVATSADCESDAVWAAEEAIENAILDAMEGRSRNVSGSRPGAESMKMRRRSRGGRGQSSSDHPSICDDKIAAKTLGPCWWLCD